MPRSSCSGRSPPDRSRNTRSTQPFAAVAVAVVEDGACVAAEGVGRPVGVEGGAGGEGEEGRHPFGQNDSTFPLSVLQLR